MQNSSLRPPFTFRIDEIRESTRSIPVPTNSRYDWMPSLEQGDIQSIPRTRVPDHVTYRWWMCNGSRIYEINSPPLEAVPYQTYSVFYNGGFGFWILRDDAISPRSDSTWQPLCFDHHPDGSSYLCDTGQYRTLAYRKAGQDWLQHLLPDIHYRSSTFLHNPALACGLKGDLALFLALVALGIEEASLPATLPLIFSNGTWHFQNITNGWTQKRGVVVYVHTYPPYSTRDELSQYAKVNPYFF